MTNHVHVFDLSRWLKVKSIMISAAGFCCEFLLLLNRNTVKPVFIETTCLEEPLVFWQNVTHFNVNEPVTKDPVLRNHNFMASGAIFQDRFYGLSLNFLKVELNTVFGPYDFLLVFNKGPKCVPFWEIWTSYISELELELSRSLKDKC